MFKAMDRRNANNQKGRRIRELIKIYETEKQAVDDLKNETKKEEAKVKSLYELNSIWLAQSVMDDILNMPKDLALVKQCNGCENCTDTENPCFTVIVNK